MTSADVLALFTRCGALLEGHFQLSSGLHSEGYLQCALVLQHPDHAMALGGAVADRTRRWTPDLVLSPALGGVVIGHEVARGLGVRSLFAERKDGALVLRRGFEIGAGDRVLVIEDVVTTGGSTRETMAVVRDAGAQVVGAASIINRGDSGTPFDVPFEALASVSWPALNPADCPACARGVPVMKPGSRPGVRAP